MIPLNLLHQLTESTSLNLVNQIQRALITTSLSSQTIGTTYVHQGMNGTPILLLHGFDSSVMEFRRLLPLLAAENETWAVDLWGFGFTQRLFELSFNPASIATHLYYFWKTLIQQPVILVGASMGGAAAIDFTLNYPQVVKKLVLIDSAGLKKNVAISKFLVPPLGYLATQFLKTPQVRQKISETAYYDESFASHDAQICTRLHLEMPGWSQALIDFTRSGGYGDFREQLPQVQQPTLILWGENDQILGTKDADTFKQLIPQSQQVWISECGHVPHLEKAKITAAEILRFRN